MYCLGFTTLTIDFGKENSVIYGDSTMKHGKCNSGLIDIKR